MPALADRCRVIAPDLRGFGWSEAPREGYEKENLADDLLALLDELGLRRVKLVGHDWGGWLGFLLCLREPERFERYFSLNILPPWTSMKAMAPHLWRFWYQWLISSPGVGYQLHRSGKFIPKVLVGGSVRREPWDDATIHAFSDTFTQPDRARAAVQMYRVFTLREAPAIARGRYADARLRVPTKLLFGTGDAALNHQILAGTEGHAEDMEVEKVEGCGHFIVDEMPDLVAARAREFFTT